MLIKSYRPSGLGIALISYFIVAIAIGIFSFGFLNTTTLAVAYRFIEEGNVVVGNMQGEYLYIWINIASIIGATIVGIAVLLFMLREKFSYIIDINNTIQCLEGGDLSKRVALIGDDELSDLAESINNMATTMEAHIKAEEKLKTENADMVAALSHDIRTPLTSIISYIDFIKNGKCEDVSKQEKYIDIIQSKAYQIKAITDELFERASIMNNEVHERSLEKIDCGLLLMQILDEKQEELEEEGFIIEIDSEELNSFEMEIDIHDVARIFENISSNIIKYADNSKVVKFIISNTKDSFKIYESNFIDESEKPVESHGIGIKSCEHIANSYGGTMSVQCNEDIFEIELIIKG